MYLQAFGEVITDALTVNPALGDIPSASAILDTSNYTFQAVTFGKDSQGFQYHAHSVSTIEGPGDYNGGQVIIQSYEDSSVSSYYVSSTHLAVADYVSSLPSYPAITDTRLERGSTSVSSFSPNLGHYTNIAIDSSLPEAGWANPSNAWNVAGSYPPPGNIGEYIFLDNSGVQLFSGTLSSHYNDNQLVDVNGYIKVSDTIYSADSTNFDEGSFLVSTVSYPTGSFRLKTRLAMGDAASLAAFGGVNHIGAYCLDMKSMLAEGLTPPYAWDALNNTRNYKLVAKTTVVDNLLRHSDFTYLSVDFSGFENVLNSNGLFSAGGPVFSLYFILT